MDLAALAAIAGGANADAVACAAREADWRALRWTAEKLVLHAAQNPNEGHGERIRARGDTESSYKIAKDCSK